jgi:type IV pilus secretin PilQ/predicted competence protein
MKKILVFALVLSVVWGALAGTRISAQTSEPLPASNQTVSGNQAPAVNQTIIEYLEFREVDIKDVLRQLAKQYNLNIVFSEAVRGLVTVQLNSVTIEQALDSIVTVNGFAYTKKENVYKITTADEASREGKQTKLFRLNNADAVKLKETLSKVLSPDGSIEADSRSNAIIVTDSFSVISKIENMIPALDELTLQVLIEAKIIETSLTNSEKLGIDWTTTISATGSARPTTFPFDKWGTSNRYFPEQKFTTDNGTVSSDFPNRNGQLGAFPSVDATKFTFGTLSFSSLQAIFNMIKTRGDTKLIASPRIVTLNNQLAKINVGKVVPIATYERNGNTGNWEITGWEQQNVGINLEVTPQISPDGHIKLKLKPEVSNIIDYIGTDMNRRPITSTRTAETEVIVRDGMTVVIAGLVKEKDSKTVKKIPFLGDIPLLGKIFTSQETGTSEEPKEKTDLLIFVTARIVSDKNNTPEESDAMAGAYARPFKLETRQKNEAK